MINILTVIGARPQIIKAAALSRAIRNQFSHSIKEVIVHTGQHYDDNMSKVFFDELNVPKPDYHLGAGSGSHGKQTALMIEKLEEVFLQEHPDYVVLFGDTNSTLAGTVAAVKLHIPIIHIEAGLRSYNKKMPEEINRLVCDHSSTLLFPPTQTGIDNLIREGFELNNQPPFTINRPGIFHCGDIMYDNTLYFSEMSEGRSGILDHYKLLKNQYALATIHRDNNTDQPGRMNDIFSTLSKISRDFKTDIVIPLHPRASNLLSKNLKPELFNELNQNPYLKIIPPASFFEINVLEKFSKIIFTDSGGVQKEAYFHKKPVLILRGETEWTEIVENGTGILTDTDPLKIRDGFTYFETRNDLDFPPVFGDGSSAERICHEILNAASF